MYVSSSRLAKWCWHLLWRMVELSHDGYLPGAGGQRAALMPAVLPVLSSAGSSALQRCCCQATRRQVGWEFRQKCQSFSWQRLSLAVCVHVVSEAGPEMVANFEGNPVRRCLSWLSCIFLNGWNCGEKYFLDFFFPRFIFLPCLSLWCTYCIGSGCFEQDALSCCAGRDELAILTLSGPEWAESSPSTVNKSSKFSC